ncbi:MAG TPA: hypothetical protein EYQ66_07900 [Myxococcales bacterium]|nr:hypothetical protein [Myxococcales bacterium]HIL01856.1 hypothetical protein [Myxococcales bacterium]
MNENLVRSAPSTLGLGVSNSTPEQVNALVAHLDTPLSACQPEFFAAHLAPLGEGTLDQCAATGRVPLP